MAYRIGLCIALVSLVSCGDDDGTAGGEDSGALIADSGSSSDGGNVHVDSAVPPPPSECATDDDCSDNVYCNGAEVCDDGECKNGAAVACDDGIACTTDICLEAARTCRPLPPDLDGDGHFDVRCVDENDTPFGRDCDDGDPLRFPGNIEVCDESHHDEDCDPNTNGEKDNDNDDTYDIECCNPITDEEGSDLRCGTDCNDLQANVSPNASEVCDQFDNDCDGDTDEGVKIKLYIDRDFDGHLG
jgi:hypothetical protein